HVVQGHGAAAVPGGDPVAAEGGVEGAVVGRGPAGETGERGDGDEGDGGQSAWRTRRSHASENDGCGPGVPGTLGPSAAGPSPGDSRTSSARGRRAATAGRRGCGRGGCD